MKLFNHLLTGFIFVGCAQTQVSNPPTEEIIEISEESTEEQEPKYKVGDCLMIVDLPSGETTSPYRVRVEKVENGAYWYRWLLDGNVWARDLSCLRRGNDPCSKFESLEKISKKVNDCPK